MKVNKKELIQISESIIAAFDKVTNTGNNYQELIDSINVMKKALSKDIHKEFNIVNAAFWFPNIKS